MVKKRDGEYDGFHVVLKEWSYRKYLEYDFTITPVRYAVRTEEVWTSHKFDVTEFYNITPDRCRHTSPVKFMDGSLFDTYEEAHKYCIDSLTKSREECIRIIAAIDSTLKQSVDYCI